MHQEDNESFIEGCFPTLKLRFSYFWINFQARKRRYYKKHEQRMPVEIQHKELQEIECTPIADKVKWAQNLLRKLKKDIKPEHRDEFVRAVNGHKASGCVVSNPDQKGKLRRIDCLRQADKVWRLDLVVMILFHATPLESTDSERLERTRACDHRSLCVNPSHIGLVAKEFDLYMYECLLNKESIQTNIIVTGILSKTDLEEFSRENYSTTVENYHRKSMAGNNFKHEPRSHPYANHFPKREEWYNNDSTLKLEPSYYPPLHKYEQRFPHVKPEFNNKQFYQKDLQSMYPPSFTSQLTDNNNNNNNENNNGDIINNNDGNTSGSDSLNNSLNMSNGHLNNSLNNIRYNTPPDVNKPYNNKQQISLMKRAEQQKQQFQNQQQQQATGGFEQNFGAMQGDQLEHSMIFSYPLNGSASTKPPTTQAPFQGAMATNSFKINNNPPTFAQQQQQLFNNTNHQIAPMGGMVQKPF